MIIQSAFNLRSKQDTPYTPEELVTNAYRFADASKPFANLLNGLVSIFTWRKPYVNALIIMVRVYIN